MTKKIRHARTKAFLNQKGGVGKTTSTINLAGAAAMMGYKTLVIDMDQQGNTTIGLGIQNPELTTYEALVEGQIGIYEYSDNLHVLPSDDRLGTLELALNSEKVPIGRERRLKKLIEAEFRNAYDLILIDCPPSVNIYSLNALVAADSILIPLEAKLYAVKGLQSIIDAVNTVKEEGLNDTLDIEGVFFVNHDETPVVSRDISSDVRSMVGGRILSTFIRKNIAIEEAVMCGQHVFDYEADKFAEDKESGRKQRPPYNATIDYMALYKELFENQISATHINLTNKTTRNKDAEVLPEEKVITREKPKEKLSNIGSKFQAYLNQQNNG